MERKAPKPHKQCRVLDRYYRVILDASPDGVLVETKDRVAYINDAYGRLLGYRNASDLSCASIRDIAHPEDQDRLNFYGHRRAEGKAAPSRYGFRVRGQNGTVLTLDASVSVARVGGELLIITVARRAVDVAAGDVSAELKSFEMLSPRERQIFRFLLAGRRSKEIALDLDISEKTVATHRSRLYHKLAFRSDLDMFRFAAERGLLHGSVPGTAHAE